MIPRTQFGKLHAELLEKGELVLKTIMHNGEEESSLKLVKKGRRYLVEEISAIEGGKISRRTHTISQTRAENLMWANLPPIQSSKEENPSA